MRLTSPFHDAPGLVMPSSFQIDSSSLGLAALQARDAAPPTTTRRTEGDGPRAERLFRLSDDWDLKETGPLRQILPPGDDGARLLGTLLPPLLPGGVECLLFRLPLSPPRRDADSGEIDESRGHRLDKERTRLFCAFIDAGVRQVVLATRGGAPTLLDDAGAVTRIQASLGPSCDRELWVESSKDSSLKLVMSQGPYRVPPQALSMAVLDLDSPKEALARSLRAILEQREVAVATAGAAGRAGRLAIGCDTGIHDSGMAAAMLHALTLPGSPASRDARERLSDLKTHIAWQRMHWAEGLDWDRATARAFADGAARAGLADRAPREPRAVTRTMSAPVSRPARGTSEPRRMVCSAPVSRPERTSEPPIGAATLCGEVAQRFATRHAGGVGAMLGLKDGRTYGARRALAETSRLFRTESVRKQFDRWHQAAKGQGSRGPDAVRAALSSWLEPCLRDCFEEADQKLRVGWRRHAVNACVTSRIESLEARLSDAADPMGMPLTVVELELLRHLRAVALP